MHFMQIYSYPRDGQDKTSKDHQGNYSSSWGRHEWAYQISCQSTEDILLNITDVNLVVEEKSADHYIQLDLFSESHECLNKTTEIC